jgi:hypothetical protein
MPQLWSTRRALADANWHTWHNYMHEKGNLVDGYGESKVFAVPVTDDERSIYHAVWGKQR